MTVWTPQSTQKVKPSSYIYNLFVLSITIDFHGKFRGRAPIAADFPDSKVAAILLDFICVNNPGIMCSFLVHWVHVLQVMHEFPVVGKSSTSVSRQDFIKHKLEPGRLQNFRKIEVISSDIIKLALYSNLSLFVL